jgi:hypothetical protein
MKSTVAACVAALLALGAAGSASGTTYLDLYADANHSITKVDGTPWYSAEAWIWCLPDAKGMIAAEFSLAYSNVIPSTVTMNSAISVALGSLPGDISLAFSSCQQGWTWIAHQTFWVIDSEYGEVVLGPRSDASLNIASCESGYPTYPARSLNNRLSINCQATSELFKPRLTNVAAIAPDTILATFDNSLIEEACWFPQTHNFRVFSATSPSETLDVVGVWFWDHWRRIVWVRLGQNLVPGVDYILEGVNICNDDWVGNCCFSICQCFNCADSEMGFTYAPIATLLRDFSVEPLSEAVRVSWELGAIDEGISFLPMRLEKGALEFEALPVEVMEEHGLRYRFVDGSARPGEAFRYRVDYIRGGDRHTLFETDWVEPLPAKFVLRQNLPNPFNPSTRISFELGESCRAALAVYDVRGKLVQVLARGPMEAGAHSAVWDGRNERGDPVASGVYFYRLRAGSFTETKKLVLLR